MKPFIEYGKRSRTRSWEFAFQPRRQWIITHSTHKSTRPLTSAGRSLNRTSRAEQHAFIISSNTKSEHFLLREGQKYIKYSGDMRGAAVFMLCVFLILAQHQKQSCGLIPMKCQQNRVADGTLVFRWVKCVIKRYILQYTANTTNETTRDAPMYQSLTFKLILKTDGSLIINKVHLLCPIRSIIWFLSSKSAY